MNGDNHVSMTDVPATDNYFPSPVALRPHIQLEFPPKADLDSRSCASLGSASPARGNEQNVQEEVKVITHLTANGTLAGSTKLFPVVRAETTPVRAGKDVVVSPGGISAPKTDGPKTDGTLTKAQGAAIGENLAQEIATTPVKKTGELPSQKVEITPTKSSGKKQKGKENKADHSKFAATPEKMAVVPASSALSDIAGTLGGLLEKAPDTGIVGSSEVLANQEEELQASVCKTLDSAIPVIESSSSPVEDRVGLPARDMIDRKDIASSNLSEASLDTTEKKLSSTPGKSSKKQKGKSPAGKQKEEVHDKNEAKVTSDQTSDSTNIEPKHSENVEAISHSSPSREEQTSAASATKGGISPEIETKEKNIVRASDVNENKREVLVADINGEGQSEKCVHEELCSSIQSPATNKKSAVIKNNKAGNKSKKNADNKFNAQLQSASTENIDVHAVCNQDKSEENVDVSAPVYEEVQVSVGDIGGIVSSSEYVEEKLLTPENALNTQSKTHTPEQASHHHDKEQTSTKKKGANKTKNNLENKSQTPVLFTDTKEIELHAPVQESSAQGEVSPVQAANDLVEEEQATSKKGRDKSKKNSEKKLNTNNEIGDAHVTGALSEVNKPELNAEISHSHVEDANAAIVHGSDKSKKNVNESIATVQSPAAHVFEVHAHEEIKSQRADVTGAKSKKQSKATIETKVGIPDKPLGGGAAVEASDIKFRDNHFGSTIDKLEEILTSTNADLTSSAQPPTATAPLSKNAKKKAKKKKVPTATLR